MHKLFKITVFFIIVLSCVLSLASCVEETITVSFDTDGGSNVESIVIVKGESFAMPKAPIKEGFDFAGWYFGDKPFTEISTPLTENITLKAKWTPKEEETPQKPIPNITDSQLFSKMKFDDKHYIFTQTTKVTYDGMNMSIETMKETVKNGNSFYHKTNENNMPPTDFQEFYYIDGICYSLISGATSQEEMTLEAFLQHSGAELFKSDDDENEPLPEGKVAVLEDKYCFTATFSPDVQSPPDSPMKILKREVVYEMYFDFNFNFLNCVVNTNIVMEQDLGNGTTQKVDSMIVITIKNEAKDIVCDFAN